jgi:spore coat protein CotH
VTRLLPTVGLVLTLVAPIAARAQTSADLFDDTRLHTLELSVHSRDWADLLASTDLNTRYPVHVTWNGLRDRNVAIRSRGLSSRSSVKPGFELQFDYYASGQRFLGLQSLVLDNLVTDPSMLREVLAMATLRRVGVPAPRESFARLVVNGEYVGLYALVEPITRDFAAAAVGAEGLLFEYRWTRPYFETFPGEELEHYAALFASRNPPPQSMTGLYSPMRDLFRAIAETAEGEFESVDRWLALEETLRLAAADAVLAEPDGLTGYDGMNNVYLYRVGERSHFMSWDKDQAFSSPWASIVARADEHLLMVRILGEAKLRHFFFDAVEQTADALARDAWLESEIARHYAIVREAALSDPRKPQTNAELGDAVASLVTFARSRTAFVYKELQRLRLQ